MQNARIRKVSKGTLWAALMGFALAAPAGADTLPVQADSQVNLTAVAAKGGILTTISVKNSLPGVAYRGFAKFDLSALPGGLPVTKATLRLWPNLVTTEGNIDVVAILDPWEEATLTAITAPSLSQPVTDFTVRKADLKTYVNVDVTELVKDWVTQTIPNHGLALLGQPGNPVNARFDSKENLQTSHPMELEVMLGLPAGSGDITSIIAGTGLSGGGNLGDVTLAVNPAVIQRRVSGSCAVGSSIRSIDVNGLVTCQAGDMTGVTAGFGLTGGGLAGDVSLAVNTAQVQQRVTGACAVGSSIRSIDAAGGVICEPDAGIVNHGGNNSLAATAINATNQFFCRTGPYTATAGDRAWVWVTASCTVPVGRSITAAVGYNAGAGDITTGTIMPVTNTGGALGGLPGYLHTSHMNTISLVGGNTYTFATAIRNPDGTANWASTCYCNTMVQISR